MFVFSAFAQLVVSACAGRLQGGYYYPKFRHEAEWLDNLWNILLLASDGTGVGMEAIWPLQPRISAGRGAPRTHVQSQTRSQCRQGTYTDSWPDSSVADEMLTWRGLHC